MTTKQDLIDGFNMIIREGERITSTFTPEDWKKTVHDDEGGGWNRKQVYAHITSVAEIAPNMAPNLSTVGEGGNAAEGLDINALNAQMVGAKEAMSEEELMAAFRKAFENLIGFTQEFPEEQLAAQTSFGSLSGTVADTVDSLLVLHALAHIYSAGASATG